MASSIVVKNGETLPQFYRRLVWRAKELDPRTIEGACSPNEITRMQTRVEQLEREAEEKAAKDRSQDPLNIANGKRRELWRRGHEASVEISQLQEKARPYRRAFKITGLPENLFEAPTAHGIPENHPLGWTVEDYQACIAEATPKVEALEGHAASLGHHISAWERLTSGQQIWKALSALAERLDG